MTLTYPQQAFHHSPQHYAANKYVWDDGLFREALIVRREPRMTNDVAPDWRQWTIEGKVRLSALFESVSRGDLYTLQPFSLRSASHQHIRPPPVLQGFRDLRSAGRVARWRALRRSWLAASCRPSVGSDRRIKLARTWATYSCQPNPCPTSLIQQARGLSHGTLGIHQVRDARSDCLQSVLTLRFLYGRNGAFVSLGILIILVGLSIIASGIAYDSIYDWASQVSRPIHQLTDVILPFAEVANQGIPCIGSGSVNIIWGPGTNSFRVYGGASSPSTGTLNDVSGLQRSSIGEVKLSFLSHLWSEVGACCTEEKEKDHRTLNPEMQVEVDDLNLVTFVMSARILYHIPTVDASNRMLQHNTRATTASAWASAEACHNLSAILTNRFEQGAKIDHSTMEIHPASATHTHTIILLHGRDSIAAEFAAEFLESQASDARTLPERFPHVKWVFPGATPQRAARFACEMSQWFDMHSTTEPHARADEQDLRASVRQIIDVVGAETALVGAERVVLGGISQGCAVGVHALLHDGVRLAGFVGWCGWLPRGYATASATAGGARETPVLLGHARDDEVIDVSYGAEMRDALRGIGMDVRWCQYEDGGHWVNEPRGIDDFVEFLEERGF
nr:acyl-protein thioesterase 1 [Quercus suber]